MERVGVLVNRLFEQYQQHESPERLLITVQLLLWELQQQKNPSAASSEKVAVLMPANLQTAHAVDESVAENGSGKERSYTFPSSEENKTGAFALHEKNTEKQKEAWSFDPFWDVPTLAHQNKELNEVMTSKEESLNDRLKLEQTELGRVLTETPIADLRKAIGINDRFLLINELFGGDGTTYERCVKTINAFNNLSEAEYWIKKELKLKLGWPENSATVKYFDQLVKRRFS